MKIGITYNNVCALHLYRLFLYLEHDVELIRLSDTDNDVLLDKNTIYINDISKKDYDILIDIDGVIRPGIRKRIAEKTNILIRGFVQFSELDKSVYPDSSFPRSFDGVSEIWVWDILNSEESLDCLRDLYGCPIRRIPFIWDSCHLVTYNIQNGIEKPNKTIRIMEKNTDNTNSNILLLSGIPELKKALENTPYEYEFVSHCSQEFWENRFLKENVLDNIQYNTIPIKREDYIPNNSLTVNDIVLSHVRFSKLKLELIDLAWLGIPFVHNSPILASLCEELLYGYYSDNSISEMIQAVIRILDTNTNTNIIYVRKLLQKYWGIEENAEKWRSLLTPSGSLSPPSGSLSPPSGSLSPPSGSLSPPSGSLSPAPFLEKPEILIGFSDMWPGFNYNSNFLIDAIRHETYETYNVRGIDYWSSYGKERDKINAIIFSPLGNNWKQINSNIPKIFFSGENCEAPSDESIKLFLMPKRDCSTENAMYVPTWMIFLDWFKDNLLSDSCKDNLLSDSCKDSLLSDSCKDNLLSDYCKDTHNIPNGIECEDNPIRFPISLATRSHPKKFSDRQEFCGFVVSNPVCKMRNDTFHTVNNYKHVNSGGALFNNIGGQLTLKYPGGGCGDISKYHFLEQHKFQLCFENSQAAGYVTEKLLHSKLAGCVPIYWGDINAELEFLEDGFLNVSDCSSAEEVLERIKLLEEDIDICEKIATTPALDSTLIQKGYQLMSEMSKRILYVCGINSESMMESIIESKTKCNTVTEIQSNTEIESKYLNKIMVINLDKRQDRWNKWNINNKNINKDICNIVERISAVDGSTIKMNTTIYELFKNNQFGWRKSIMGCALSHIKVWHELMNELDDSMYFICEDDMCPNTEWSLSLLNTMIENIPEGAELLYLGGVLPSNKQQLPSVLEQVNTYWAKIKPNTLFIPEKETDTFHFCAYSYLLTKSGAKKLIQWLEESDMRCFTGIDHILGSYQIGLHKYISTPLITQCFQEEEHAYINADFNSCIGDNSFDSDTRNLLDSFSIQEIMSSLSVNDKEYSINNVLDIICENTICENSISENIYYLKEYVEGDNFKLYEGKWLTEILGKYSLEEFTYENFIPGSYLLVMRPHSDKIGFICNQLDKKGIDFKILHLSDEFCTDSIDFYSLKYCKQVVRNYMRNDLPQLDKVHLIPLGYHHTCDKEGIGEFKERELIWSFCGTSWFNRKDILNKFTHLTPNKVHLLDTWNNPDMFDEKEYSDILKNSKFCPILRGNNCETFRLYECLEHGVIPIIIVEPDSIRWIIEKLCLIKIDTVEKAQYTIQYFLDNPDIAEKYRVGLMEKWKIWKEDIIVRIKQ
jgi:GR25 family glycosyltransferase involved in LPS biosynthesis